MNTISIPRKALAYFLTLLLAIDMLPLPALAKLAPSAQGCPTVAMAPMPAAHDGTPVAEAASAPSTQGGSSSPESSPAPSASSSASAGKGDESPLASALAVDETTAYYEVRFALPEGTSDDEASAVELPEPVTVAAGTQVWTLPEAACGEERVFDGWFYDAALTEPAEGEDTVEKNLTLYPLLVAAQQYEDAFRIDYISAQDVEPDFEIMVVAEGLTEAEVRGLLRVENLSKVDEFEEFVLEPSRGPVPDLEKLIPDDEGLRADVQALLDARAAGALDATLAGKLFELPLEPAAFLTLASYYDEEGLAAELSGMDEWLAALTDDEAALLPEAPDEPGKTWDDFQLFLVDLKALYGVESDEDLLNYCRGELGMPVDTLDDLAVSLGFEPEPLPGTAYYIVRPAGGLWNRGDMHQVEIADTAQLRFVRDGEPTSEFIVYYNITVHEDDFDNMRLNPGIVFLPAGEVEGVELDGGLFSIEGDVDSGLTLETSDESGILTYVGPEQIGPGTTVAVYDGVLLDGGAVDGSVGYFKITEDLGGGRYAYDGPDYTDVVFLPDMIPAKDDGSFDDGEILLTDDQLDFSGTVYETIGLTEDAVVEPGDFLVVYSGDLAALDGVALVGYAEITEVAEVEGGLLVRYDAVDQQTMECSADMYMKIDNVPIPLTDQDQERLTREIEDDMEQSNFAEETTDYITQLILGEDVALPDNKYAESMNELKFQQEDGGELTLDEVRELAAGSKVEVKLPPDLSIQIGLGLQHFDGTGIRGEAAFQLEIIFTLNDNNQLKVTVTGLVELEVALGLTCKIELDWRRAWVFPYIYDINGHVGLYAGIYVGAGVTVTVQTAVKESDDSIDGMLGKVTKDEQGNAIYTSDKQTSALTKIKSLGTSIQSLAKASKAGSDGLHVSSIPGAITSAKPNTRGKQGKVNADTDEMHNTVGGGFEEKYANFIKGSDAKYVRLVDVNLVTWALPTDPLHILAISLGIDFVISFKVNVMLGASITYANGKEICADFTIFHPSSTSKCGDLETPNFQVDFFIFGMLGLRIGFLFDLRVGAVSTKVASIGVTAEVGLYIEFYGYFYVAYKWNAADGPSDEMFGSLLLQVGAYVDIKFKAQMGDGRLQKEVDLWGTKIPFISLGQEVVALDFTIEPDDKALTVDIKDGVSATLPVELYGIKRLGISTGDIGGANMDRAVAVNNGGQTYTSMGTPYTQMDEQFFHVTYTPTGKDWGEPTGKEKSGFFYYNPVTNTVTAKPSSSADDELWGELTFTYYNGFAGNRARAYGNGDGVKSLLNYGAGFGLNTRVISRTVRLHWKGEPQSAAVEVYTEKEHNTYRDRGSTRSEVIEDYRYDVQINAELGFNSAKQFLVRGGLFEFRSTEEFDGLNGCLYTIDLVNGLGTRFPGYKLWLLVASYDKEVSAAYQQQVADASAAANEVLAKNMALIAEARRQVNERQKTEGLSKGEAMLLDAQLTDPLYDEIYAAQAKVAQLQRRSARYDSTKGYSFVDYQDEILYFMMRKPETKVELYYVIADYKADWYFVDPTGSTGGYVQQVASEVPFRQGTGIVENTPAAVLALMGDPGLDYTYQYAYDPNVRNEKMPPRPWGTADTSLMPVTSGTAFPCQNATVLVSTTPKTFSVTWAYDDGAQTTNVAYRSGAVQPKAPTRTDQDFQYWVDEGGNQYRSGFAMPAKDLVLTPVFVGRTERTVTWILDGQTKTSKAKAGTNPLSTCPFTLDAKAKVVWYENPDDPTSVVGEGYALPDKDTTLYGQYYFECRWVLYDTGNRGYTELTSVVSAPAYAKVLENVPSAVSRYLTDARYTYSYYRIYETDLAKVKAGKNSWGTVYGSTVFYPYDTTYILQRAPVMVNVTWKYDDGDVVTSNWVGRAVTEPKAATRAGYAFDYWADADGKKYTSGSTRPPAGGVTLYPHFTEVPHQTNWILYDTGNKSYTELTSETTQLAGQKVLENVPSAVSGYLMDARYTYSYYRIYETDLAKVKAGKNSWGTVYGSTVFYPKDTTYILQRAPVMVNVTWKYDDGDVVTSNWVGRKLTPPKDIAREDYDFTGWADADGKAYTYPPYNDLTLYPQFVEHAWDEGAVTTPATCLGTGVMTYTCTRCGKTREAEIAALGHSWVDASIGSSAYLTEKGEGAFEADLAAGQEKHVCERCGEEKLGGPIMLVPQSEGLEVPFQELFSDESWATVADCTIPLGTATVAVDEAEIDRWYTPERTNEFIIDATFTFAEDYSDQTREALEATFEKNPNATVVLKVNVHAYGTRYDAFEEDDPTWYGRHDAIDVYAQEGDFVDGTGTIVVIGHEHEWDYDKEVYVAHTDTQDGYREYPCTVEGCEKTLREVIPAGHTWEVLDVASEAYAEPVAEGTAGALQDIENGSWYLPHYAVLSHICTVCREETEVEEETSLGFSTSLDDPEHPDVHAPEVFAADLIAAGYTMLGDIDVAQYPFHATAILPTQDGTEYVLLDVPGTLVYASKRPSQDTEIASIYEGGPKFWDIDYYFQPSDPNRFAPYYHSADRATIRVVNDRYGLDADASTAMGAAPMRSLAAAAPEAQAAEPEAPTAEYTVEHWKQAFAYKSEFATKADLIRYLYENRGVELKEEDVGEYSGANNAQYDVWTWYELVKVETGEGAVGTGIPVAFLSGDDVKGYELPKDVPSVAIPEAGAVTLALYYPLKEAAVTFDLNLVAGMEHGWSWTDGEKIGGASAVVHGLYGQRFGLPVVESRTVVDAGGTTEYACNIWSPDPKAGSGFSSADGVFGEKDETLYAVNEVVARTETKANAGTDGASKPKTEAESKAQDKSGDQGKPESESKAMTGAELAAKPGAEPAAEDQPAPAPEANPGTGSETDPVPDAAKERATESNSSVEPQPEPEPQVEPVAAADPAQDADPEPSAEPAPVPEPAPAPEASAEYGQPEYGLDEAVLENEGFAQAAADDEAAFAALAVEQELEPPVETPAPEPLPAPEPEPEPTPEPTPEPEPQDEQAAVVEEAKE